MRKFEQKQLLDLASTIKNLNGKLAQIYQSGNQDIFMEVLESEQTAAISIGTRIDRMIEMESATLSQENKEFLENIVRRLEEYCELLWKASQVESQFQLANSLYVLDTKLSQIAEDLEKIPARYEVVFLPYKASMWDCMETVWRAAVEDEECDVYVVPIPYFDLDTEGKPKEMHCEIDLMPANVSVVDYKNYSIEERKPDVIYIHNPFDEYNKVTSVHPNYYCSYLKDYTNMLVYIPYFLSSERLSETHSMLPAYVYADKIVLANEKMMDDIDHSIPREKFIIAGSPKEERMIWMELHKDELLIPQEWKDTIKGRKVVFYNVSISGLLKYREKMIDKMDEVFGIFEKRQDVVLLYRPHPLIETTMSSMCPELLEDYQKLVKRVKSMENAIYDTTPDVGVSVAVADAYIGESSSSVVQMFRTVQKPIMYLNEEKYYQPTLDEMLAERTSDVCRVGDDLWFVTFPLQMLCKYSLIDNTIEHVANVPEVDGDNYYKYVNIVHYEGKLIMIPYRGESLCIYDMNRKVFKKDYFKAENANSCFGRGFLYKNFLFLTPINYPSIVRYDIVTGEYAYYEEGIGKAYERIPEVEEKAPFVWGVDVWENEIYLASTMVNIVITFNMATCEYSISDIGKEGNTYRGMVADEKYCWMILTDSPNVVRWNRQTGEVCEYMEFPEGFIPGTVPFKNIMDMGDALYLVPAHANQICVLDKQSGVITTVDFGLPYAEGTFASEYYSKVNTNYEFAKKISEHKIVACSHYDNSIVVMNVTNKSFVKTPIRIETRLELEISKKNVQALREGRENINMPLSKFLKCIESDLLKNKPRRGIPKRKLNGDAKVGAEIYTEVKKCLVSLNF